MKGHKLYEHNLETKKKAGAQRTLDELCSMKHGITFTFALTGYFVEQFFFDKMITESSPYLKEQNQRKWS